MPNVARSRRLKRTFASVRVLRSVNAFEPGSKGLFLKRGFDG